MIKLDGVPYGALFAELARSVDEIKQQVSGVDHARIAQRLAVSNLRDRVDILENGAEAIRQTAQQEAVAMQHEINQLRERLALASSITQLSLNQFDGTVGLLRERVAAAGKEIDKLRERAARHAAFERTTSDHLHDRLVKASVATKGVVERLTDDVDQLRRRVDSLEHPAAKDKPMPAPEAGARASGPIYFEQHGTFSKEHPRAAITTRFEVANNSIVATLSAGYAGHTERCEHVSHNVGMSPSSHRRAAEALCKQLGLTGTLVCGKVDLGSYVFVFKPEAE